MLKQLRKKFIMINMLLVSLILITVSGVQVYTALRQATAETDATLRHVLQWRDSGPDRWQIGLPPDSPPGKFSQNMIPAICVILNPNGTVTTILDNNVDIADETLNYALSQVLSRAEDSGRLADLDLKYRRSYSGLSLRVAFVDLSWERSMISRQVLTSLAVFVLAMAGFFAASIFLSRWALRPTERSWKQQQQFIADASHELKTPLTVLLADTDILLSHPDATIQEQRKWVQYIQDEGRRMKALVEDMLFLARSDSAKEKELERLPVVLSDLCWNSLLAFEPVAFERRACLDQSIDDGVTVTGDPAQLNRLITILLDNACKYCGPEGRVSLALTRSNDRAVLTVHNTGAPIPSDALPHLFERFYRVDTARARQTGGYGLGLAIAASIVQQHHGKISAVSSAESGTTFTVSLPT